MIHRITVATLLITLLTASGGHLAVLQAIAWIKMIHERSQNENLLSLIPNVFSGEKPCPLCHTVQKLNQQQKEQEPATNIQWSKVEVLLPQSPSHSFALNVAPNIYPLPENQHFWGHKEPPTPPPPKA